MKATNLKAEKNYLVRLFFILLISCSYAQVGINTTSPSGGSLLDVERLDKGILVPRVNIADLNTIAPVTGGTTESLLVYNTNTTTGKGFYYWDGSQWVGLSGGAGSDDWTTTGNSGTTAGTNALLESRVRLCPEQYLWVHKRFKRPTPEHRDPYKDP